MDITLRHHAWNSIESIQPPSLPSGHEGESPNIEEAEDFP